MLYYFYKISCKDVNIQDCYVGQTTNFKSRCNDHKSCCNNEKSKQYNRKVYQFIRDNGGWVNWTITEFLCIVKEWIIQDFDLDNRNYPNYSISIIEMCQEIPGVNPENAPKMEQEQTTYYNKFINNNKWPGFYFKVEINE